MRGNLWFVDASAFLKLLVIEPESSELRRCVSESRLASSDLLRTESRRAIAHMATFVLRSCDEYLAAVHKVQLTPALLDRAGRLPGTGLRSLDAIYVACAEQLRDDLTGFVSYDRRQLAAVRELGIPTASPGVE